MTDLDAKYYRENSFIQYERVQAVLKSIKFKKNETILDVGCGDGRITAELSKRVPQGFVLGVDPSSSMIDLAIQSFSKQEYPNLDFKKMAAEEILLEPSVDIAFIMNTLHWIRDPWKALKNVSASLKLGGALIILTYPKESRYMKFLEEILKEKEWMIYAEKAATKTILTSREYEKILEACGLKIESSSVEEKIAIYPTPEDLKAYVKGWLNCYIPISKEFEDQFLQKAAENAMAFSLNHSGSKIELPYTKMVLKARKVGF